MTTPSSSLDSRLLAMLDAIDEVVETGVPYHESGAEVADAVTGDAQAWLSHDG